MFCEKAIALVKELDRNRDNLPPYNTDLIKEVEKEICELRVQIDNDNSVNDESRTLGAGTSFYSSTRVRKAAIDRNVRCLMAYHYNRIRCLRTMRWEFGIILPPEIKANLSASEATWFSKYSSCLSDYMRSIGEYGVNLAVDLKPPKSIFIDVRCLMDYGKYRLSDGTTLLLKKNSQHYLPRAECEELIRQGVFQHIIS